MMGVKMLCNTCYADTGNHSATTETTLITPDDRRYLGSPTPRRCDQCGVSVPYAPQNPQADPFTGRMRVLSQCCGEPIVQTSFMDKSWPVCIGCHKPIGNRGPEKKVEK